MTTDDSQPAPTPIARRLKVVVPCLAVLLLLTTSLASSETSHYGWNWTLGARMWLSLMSGPLACWIEFSGRFGLGDKAFYTIMTFVLIAGILSHAIWPRKITAAVTILSSAMWLLWGGAITCVGV